MAVNANTYLSSNAKLNREDLISLFKTVGQGDTPFMDGIRKTKATNTLHEWGCQTMAEPADNAAQEGGSFDIQALTAPARLNNKTQIFTKVVSISKTQLAINNVGAEQMGETLKLKMQEMKRDEESRLLTGSQIVSAAGSTGTKMRGVDGFLKTNLNMGASGVAPDYATNTARTGGTARAFSESLVKDVVAKIWSKGGKPNVILCSFGKKQAFSGFHGGVSGQSGMRDANSAKYASRVDVYGSDNGDLKIVPDYCMPQTSVFILDLSLWRLATLRDIDKTQLPNTADATGMAITHEITLEALNEAGSGAIHDLT